jgi:F0F1-type ATP synthase membrane subunit b/b'
MINITNEPSDTHKKILQRRKNWETHGKIQDTVNKKVQDARKKFQDTINKEHEKTQKQINEFREDFNKHQSETKDTIKKERYMNWRRLTQNIKEELNKDKESLRKKESNRNPENKKSI